MKILAATILSCATFLTACATSGQKTNREKAREEVSESTPAIVGQCAATKYPEGILAFGFVAAVNTPLAPVVAVAYYGSVLFQCHSLHQENRNASSDVDALRRELMAKIEKVKTEASQMNIARIRNMEEQAARPSSSQADLREAAAKISAETTQFIQRKADETIQSVYQHMDEVRRVKIQVVPDNDVE